ncbi:unnamed protein product [Camellia sinensis]
MLETPELADEAGVKIFSADIIYHLFDQFKAYTDNFKEEKKKEASEEAVYPCVLQIMPNCVFNKRGPIVLGVDVVKGIAKELKADAKLNVPGLLVIDTHGHESFANLRSRGSGLCDITILEVDIMHGLEPQTIESLNLLKRRNTEFIVALNKVDRLYGWKVCRSAPLVKAMKRQSKDVQIEFNAKLTQVITQLKEQGLNYGNKEMGETYSTVPTCAISGEGIPDLLLLLVQWTQETMIEKLTYSNEVQGTYLHHKESRLPRLARLLHRGLEHAIAGTALYVVGPDDDLEDIKEAALEDMKSALSRIGKTGEGACVQASTLGSLEALREFLKSPAGKIPVSGISVGPVHKKDAMKASVMLEQKQNMPQSWPLIFE